MVNSVHSCGSMPYYLAYGPKHPWSSRQGLHTNGSLNQKKGESISANHPDTNTKSAELRLVSIQKLITVIHVVSWTAGCGYMFPLIEHGLSMIAKPYFQWKVKRGSCKNATATQAVGTGHDSAWSTFWKHSLKLLYSFKSIQFRFIYLASNHNITHLEATTIVR